MKKIKYLAMLLFAAMVSMATVSCSDSGDNNEGGNGNGGNGGGTPGDTISASEQKKRLESIANEFVDKINADQFTNLKEIAEAIDGADNSAISDWADACMDACLVETKGDTVCSYLFVASNFTGSFVLDGNKWTLSNDKVDNLQFKFKDKEGKDCVLKLEHSGKETKIHHESFDRVEYRYIWNEYSTPSEYTHRDIDSLSIPENITVTLTQGGKTVVSTDIHTTLTVGSGDIDLTRDEVEVTISSTVNDYKLELQKALYSKSEKASVQSFVITKDSEELISLSAEVAFDISNPNNPVCKSGSFEVKVLGGKARVAGNVTDGKALQDCLNKAYDNNQNDEEYKRYIEEVNSYAPVKLYLDNSDKYAATVCLKPFKEDPDENHSSWTCEPVLVFNDGSSYTFVEYFDEESFKNVIKKVEDLIEDFTKKF